MKHIVIATAAIAIGAVASIPVLAAGDHGAGTGRTVQGAQNIPQMGSSGMMGGGSNGMMGMMQSFQNSMMGSAPTGNGMMGYGDAGMSGFGALQNEFDVDDDGTVTPEEFRTGLLDSLETYDADSNGTLSLDEFEALNANRIRELTVDRFQAFDADGDGEVTIDEFSTPADRFEQMARLRASTPLQQPGNLQNDGTANNMGGN